MQNKMEAPIVQPIRDDRQFLHTRTAGFEVPLFQSLATAVIVGLVTLAIALVFDWLDPLKPTVTMAGLSLAGWWLYSLKRWTRLTGPDPVQVQMRSVDHDGNPATPKIVRVQIDKVTENGHVKQTRMFDLPATEDQLSALAEGLLKQNRSFSEREWTGAGRPFSVDEFRKLRAEFIRRELVALKSEKDARQGYTLTDDGKAVLEQFLSE
ncbi:MAG: hypothetical protein HY867_06240 [Chloroflexi bacterium]|nr:hypothetical protein [Chloroflexota bacterium]